jgi:hypothetical protein
MLAVTKLQSALTSLIAVIPALILAFFVVSAMLYNSENLNAMAYIFLVGTLLAALATAVIPGLIMYQGKPKQELVKVPAPKDASSGSQEIEELDEDVEVSESSHGSSGSFDAHDVLAESSEINIGNSDSDLLGGESEAEIETEPVEDLDDFDLEEVEEEKPKPNKKKR